MKTVFRLTMLSVLGLLSVMAFSTRAFADTTPEQMHISCSEPNPDHQTGLHRPKGDGNIWTFQVVLDGDARFVKGPVWDFPGKNGSDPDWGLVTGGADGDSSMNWSSPGKTGDFQVRVNGQISCGDGGDGEPIDFSAGWDGTVDYNAEIKVKRSGTPEADYSTSATVAAGGLGSSEHKADVVVIATDDDGNPMEGITVDTPTITNGEGSIPANDASISAVNATTDEEGKAYLTFTSGDILGSVTLELDGEESAATASIEQGWTTALDEGNWDYEPYFYYDTPSSILFKMALKNDGNVPIAGHDIHYIVTKIVGVEWDPDAGWDWDGDGSPDGDYEPKIVSGSEIESEEYSNLVSFGNNNGKATESPAGTYTAQLVVPSNNEFWVFTIDFNVIDWLVYEQ